MDADDLMLAAEWSELPVDLLGLIIDKLQKNTFFLLDYIRFGAICFEWRKSFLCIQNYKQIKLPSNLPVLLLPSQFNDEEEEEDYNHGLDDEEEEHDDYQDDNHEDVKDYDNHDYHNHDFDLQEEEEEEEEHQEEEEEEEEEPEPEEEEEPTEYYYKPKDIWKGQDAETRYKSTRSFYSLLEKKVNQDFQLPVPYYKNCRGSSHGWLITVDEEEQPDGTYIYPVRLLNPFRSVNNEIQLPPLTPIRELEEEPNGSYYLLKAYLSANPSSLSNPSKDLLVLGVCGSNQLIFCRPGDTVWTHSPVERKFRSIEDLICYKGRFLAIIQEGSVLELDFAHHLHPKPPSVKFVALPPANGILCNKKYLVESGGDLLQVERNNDTDDYSTTGFRAFKLNDDAAASSNDDDKWVEMDNLDGRMLFLGDNSSISLSADDFPGLMPNCIYFTDDNFEGYEAFPWDRPHDIGIFNFEDKSVVFHHGPIMPQPIWIQPML